MQRLPFLVAFAVLGSCSGGSRSGDGPGTPGPPYDVLFLWHPVSLEGAVDMGHTASAVPSDERRPAGPIELVDVTETAGLDEAFGGGNTHGVGVALVDLDGDGDDDLFIANGIAGTTYPSQLWRNRGDGTFVDATDASGVGDILERRDTYSVAGADYDDDGDVDLYVGAHPTDVLLQNQGDGTFLDRTAAARAGGPTSDRELARDGRSKIVSFGDFDGDGWLDLVSASSTLPSPGIYQLHNEGDGTFSDVTREVGAKIDDRGNPCAVLWSDYDNDADYDLWVWNDRGGKVLLNNRGAASFDDVTASSGMNAVTIGNPMGIDGADIDHDGDLDYYVSNIGNNPLLSNDGDGTFTDITRRAGTAGEFGWGLGFEDFDADAWPDIFVAQEDDRPHLVFHHLGEDPPRFERIYVEHWPIVDAGRAHNVAVAFGDFDGDGRTDVVTATTDGSRINLYANRTDLGTNRWLEVVVVGPPGTLTAGGVAARVGVKTGDLVQFREIYGGSSRASQNALTARFGLGQWTGAEWVAVQWTDGRQVVVTGVEGNQRVVLEPLQR